jgi:polysaccharide export outer membrane protein
VPPESQYVIGVGDRLDVVFLFHTNLSTRDLVVRRDGRISLPYVGDQMAAGVTPMTLDSLLTVGFSDILRDPSISVIVTQPAPQKVFVLGEVNQPGSFKFDEDVSMLQSVAMAGGFTKGALSRHAVLIRRQGVNKIVGIEVDLQSVMDGSLMGNDIQLRNYDIVYVPQHPIYSAADFMNQIYDILNQPLDLVFKGWQIANLSASYEYFRNTPVR